MRLTGHPVDDEVASGHDQSHADQTEQSRHLADQDHSQKQAEHGLVGVDGAENREVSRSQRVPEEHVAGHRQHDGGHDVRPEAHAEPAQRHAGQNCQGQRGQQSMRRDDGDEWFSRTLRELLLEDVRERVGHDSDEDSQDCERIDLSAGTQPMDDRGDVQRRGVERWDTGDQ